MRKILFGLMLLAVSAFGFAQSETGEKETVYIDYFTKSNDVNSSDVESLRSKVIEGMTVTQRVQVIDVSSNDVLKTEALRRQETSAMGDETARKEEMATLGAGSLIQGHVTSLVTTKKTYSDGKVYYESVVNFTLKVVDASTGTLRATESFENKATGDTGDLSVVECLDLPSYMMRDFMDKYFKVKGYIVQVKDLNKKSTKAESVYINLGSARGIQEGQAFIVYNVVDIAGELSNEEVGRVKVSQVMSANRSVCKVTKGGDKILEIMQNNAQNGIDSKLIIESDKDSLFGGLGRDLKSAFK